jgi:hypothetical protein
MITRCQHHLYCTTLMVQVNPAFRNISTTSNSRHISVLSRAPVLHHTCIRILNNLLMALGLTFRHQRDTNGPTDSPFRSCLQH